MFENYERAVKLFLQNCDDNGLSGETISSYRNSFRYYKEFMERSGFEDASYIATAEWKSELSKSVSVTTINLYLSNLQRLSDFGMRCKLYTDAFMDDGLLPPKKKLSKERNKEYEHVLTEEDVEKLINADRAVFTRTPHTFKREKAVMVLTLTTGLRNIELRNLRMKDLNFGEGYIYAHITKGDKPRFVPFVPIAQKAINDYLNSGLRPSNLTMEDSLFGVNTREGEWRQFERTELSELIYRYEKSIIGPDKASRSHALRHSFASICLTQGIDIGSISTILGHSSTTITARVYAKNLHPEQFASAFGQKFDELRTKEGVAS